MWDNGAGKFSGRQHSTFYMHVPVTQPRNHEPAIRLNDFGVRPRAISRIWHDAGDTSFDDCNVITGQHFACVHIDPLALANNDVCE